MKLLPCLVALAACGGSPAGPPAQSTLSGTISADETLSGVIAMTGGVTIPAGVTVTVAPGTIIEAASSASIDVEGTLSVAGVKGNVATIESATTGDFWGGVRVTGTYEMHYGSQVGGGIFTNGGSTTVIDSELSNTQGDFLVEDGGKVDIEFSNMGAGRGSSLSQSLLGRVAGDRRGPHSPAARRRPRRRADAITSDGPGARSS